MTPATPPLGDRWVELDGAANVRELGGLPAADGTHVRPGVVFRGDSPHRWTASDVARWKGLRTVIDLRSGQEVEMLAPTPLPAGAEVVAAPWRPPNVVTTIVGGVAEMSYVPLGELYEQFVQANEDHLASMFTLMAEPSRLPVLFHCYAGKDRTGISAALLLDLLGSSDEVIVADYVATDERRDRFAALADADALDLGFTKAVEINPDITRAPAEQMIDFLDRLRRRWGGAEGLLRQAGVSPTHLAALRSNLLAPG